MRPFHLSSASAVFHRATRGSFPWVIAILMGLPLGGFLSGTAAHATFAPAAVLVTDSPSAVGSAGPLAAAGGAPTTADAAYSSLDTGATSAAAQPTRGGPPGGGGGHGNETATNGTWVSVTQARCCGGIAYDPIIGQTVLFGGGAVEALGDTWEYRAGTWTRVLISSSLSVHNNVAMTYDAQDGYIVLFGGIRGNHYLAETWTFQYGAWTLLSPSNSPAARIGATMVFDAAENSVILFGGYSGTTYFNDTWRFSGGAWSPLALPVSPSPRDNASMAYDPVAGSVLLFGGRSSSGVLGDTWSYHDGAWTQLSAESNAAPSTRDLGAMAWDDGSQSVVLMGGRTPTGVLGDVWLLRDGVWSSGPAGPSARAGAMMTYDSADRYLLLFGGTTGGSVLADTWTFIDGVWERIGAGGAPVGRTGASLAIDPATGGAVLFGGWTGAGYLGDTWSYSGGNWTLLCSTGCGPVPRRDAGLTYVVTNATTGNGYLLLFGGFNGGFLNDTWALQSGLWTPINATGAPAPRAGMVLASDGTGAVAFLYGGLGASGYLADTWAFNATDGMWSAVTNAQGGGPYTPVDRAFASAVYDPTADAILIFGGRDASGYLADTWEVDVPSAGGVATWDDPVVSTSSPPARANATLAWDDDAPFSNAVLLGGTSGTTPGTEALDDIWVYASGNWTHVPTPAPGGMGGEEASSPAPRTGASAVYSPDDGYLLFFGGYNGTAIVADTWLWVIFLAQPVASLTPADSGVPVQFHAALFGGVQPFTYYWAFGDGTVSTETAPRHAFTAGEPTAYDVYVVVNDSAGNSSAMELPIVVHPALSVTVTVSASTVDVGVPLTFTAAVSGGAPPVRTTWGFGDGSRETTASVVHAYGAAGSYTVRLWANSSGGSALIELLTVGVVPRPTVDVATSLVETDVGVPVAFSATVSDGVAPTTYAWSFGDGSRSSEALPSHVYDTPGTYTVQVEVTDVYLVNASALTTVLVHPRPAISTIAASPAITDVGYPIVLEALGAGGTGGLAWTWSFGDGAAGTGAAASHAYAGAGTFLAQVWANDSLGVSAYANVSVLVVPIPRITSFAADPASIHVGDPVTLSAAIAGGVGPYSYLLSGLPAGCLSENTDTLSCRPNVTGTFSVTMYVTDTLGAQDSAVLTLTVSPVTVEPTVLGMPPSWGYLVLGLIVAFVALDAVLVYVIVRDRRRGGSASKRPA